MALLIGPSLVDTFTGTNEDDTLTQGAEFLVDGLEGNDNYLYSDLAANHVFTKNSANIGFLRRKSDGLLQRIIINTEHIEFQDGTLDINTNPISGYALGSSQGIYFSGMAGDELIANWVESCVDGKEGFDTYSYADDKENTIYRNNSAGIGYLYAGGPGNIWRTLINVEKIAFRDQDLYISSTPTASYTVVQTGESVTGSSQDDLFITGNFNEAITSINGSEGLDRYAVNGLISDFAIARDTNGSWILESAGGKDRRILKNIEKVLFIDGDVDISVDQQAPTLNGIAVQGRSVTLEFSEAVTAASVPVTAFAVATVTSANVATNRTVSAVTLDPNNPTQVHLALSGTAPASNVNLRVSYTDPAGKQTTGVVQDLAGNELSSFSNRFADTFITSATTTLASQYLNLTLTGTAAVNGTGNPLSNSILGNSNVNAITGAAGIDSMDGGDSTDRYLIATSADHSAAEVQDTGTTGSDELRFSSTTAGQTLTVYAGDTGLEQVTIGTGTGATPTTTGTTALNINASAAINGLTITGNAGTNSLIGTAFADTIIGNAGNDNINGITGDDVFNAGAGNDTMTGGNGSNIYLIGTSTGHAVAEITDNGTSGTDELRFSSTTAGQTLTVFAGDTGLEKVSIGTGSASAAVSTGTTALNINAAAALNALTITGNNGANTLTGTTFADTIIGNAGNDTVNGGLSNDNLTGGTRSDTFRFDSVLNGTTNVDRLTDFTPTAVSTTTDRIQLENTGTGLFTAITTTGTLAANAFISSSAFTTTTQRIRYDGATGNLFYDADGIGGAQASILFATLSTGLTLNNTHFQVT